MLVLIHINIYFLINHCYFERKRIIRFGRLLLFPILKLNLVFLLQLCTHYTAFPFSYTYSCVTICCKFCFTQFNVATVLSCQGLAVRYNGREMAFPGEFSIFISLVKIDLSVFRIIFYSPQKLFIL